MFLRLFHFVCMGPPFPVGFARIVTKCERFKSETQSSGTLSVVAARSGENSPGSLPVLSHRTGARGAKGYSRALRIRWRAHIPAHWIDWLLDRTSVRHAATSVDARLRGDWRLSLAVLLAQTLVCRGCGRHVRDVRSCDLPGGCARVLRAFLDCHYLERSQFVVTGTQDRSGEVRQPCRARRNSHSRQVPASLGCHPTHTAQPGVWAVSHQSF